MEQIAGPDVRDEREGQVYLRVAQSILAQTARPLNAREIVERGIEQGLFGDHAMGRTPEKSMQARLSMDILSKREISRFMRTARGRFQLRPTGNVESDGNSEYLAEKRVLRTPQEEVLCVSDNTYTHHLTFQGVDADATSVLSLILDRDSVTYVSRVEAEHRNDVKQFITYVFVQCANRLLYFKRSYLSRAAEFLRGSKCIGFGGHVTQADADLLSSADFGLSSCARRELSEELTLTPLASAGMGYAFETQGSRHSEIDSRQEAIKHFQSAPLELLGVLNDDSSEVGRRHVAVVYRIWLNDWNVANRVTKGDSSIKGLHWLDLTKDKLELQEFEYWSQLCIRKFFPANVISRSSYSVIRTCQTNKHIIVTGRIGSGKSETSRFMSDQLNRALINSGQILQELMGSPTMTEIGREHFQLRAMDFIGTPTGPDTLAAAIANQTNLNNGQLCIIDGIRHIATLEALEKGLAGQCLHVHVLTSPDVAYDMYRGREEHGLSFTYRDFLKIFDAPVEAEIEALGRQADIYLYNSFGLDAFRRTLVALCDELRMGEMIKSSNQGKRAGL